MGGLLSGPKMPPMPKMKTPKLPPTPRMPTETDPKIEERARRARASDRKGRRSTLLSDSTAGRITKQSLGGSSGNDYPGTKG